MFCKNLFSLFVFFFALLCLFSLSVVAQAPAPASAPAVIPDIDVKNLPAWLQWLLSGVGVGGLAFWGTMKLKLTKYLHLFEDCKLFIGATINMVTRVKSIIDTAAPEIKKAWYEWLYSAGHLLIETGNKSLIQKGNMLLSHVPAGAVVEKSG